MRCLSTAGILGTENVGQVWPFKEKQLCTEARLYIQRAVSVSQTTDQSAGGQIKRRLLGALENTVKRLFMPKRLDF